MKCIEKNTVDNTEIAQKCISNMICKKSDPIPLEENFLIEALSIDGEFLVLKLNYEDFDDEVLNGKIRYKMSQSLSVIVSYEDDGNSFEKINHFVKYIYDLSDPKQNSIFGVQKVEELSEYPITILFSGILPINQLKITIGKKIDEFIHSDNEYFIPRFAKHRDEISKEIGIPILPVLPALDKDLEDYTLRLVDMVDQKVISEFRVDENLTKESSDIYLLKLFYIYKVLVDEKGWKYN